MQKRTSQLTAKENEVRKSLSRITTHQSSAGSPGLAPVRITCPKFCPDPTPAQTPRKALHTRAGLQQQSSPCTPLLSQTGEPQQPHREKPKPRFKNQGSEHKGRRGGKENVCNNNNNKNNRKALLTEAMPV